MLSCCVAQKWSHRASKELAYSLGLRWHRIYGGMGGGRAGKKVTRSPEVCRRSPSLRGQERGGEDWRGSRQSVSVKERNGGREREMRVRGRARDRGAEGEMGGEMW